MTMIRTGLSSGALAYVVFMLAFTVVALVRLVRRSRK
jgi:hypothetical protein